MHVWRVACVESFIFINIYDIWSHQTGTAQGLILAQFSRTQTKGQAKPKPNVAQEASFV